MDRIDRLEVGDEPAHVAPDTPATALSDSDPCGHPQAATR